MSLNKRVEEIWNSTNMRFKAFVLDTGQQLELTILDYNKASFATRPIYSTIELYSTPFEILEALDNLKLRVLR